MRAGRLLLLLSLSLLVACSSTRPPRYEAEPEKAAQVNAQLGASYLRSGNLQRADAKLRKALREDSDNVDAHTAFALLNMRLDKPDKARKHFEIALDLAPDSPQIQNNYGTFLCDQGRFDEGIEQFLKAARNRLYETPAYAYANAGRCAHTAGRDEEARQYLGRALQRNPRLPSALRESTELALGSGRAQQARAYFERYAEVVEVSPQMLWLGVRVERAAGDRAAARKYGIQLLQRYRDSDQAREFLESR